MSYAYLIGTGLLLLVFQSTVIQNSALLSSSFYDLLTPFVVYLALFRPRRDSLALVIFFGVCMDSLSGAPFGLFLSAYFWLFMILKWVTQFLHVSSTLLLPVVVAVGVLIENFFVVLSLAAFSPGAELSPAVLHSVAAQFLWALLTGPFLLILLRNTHRRWNRWVWARTQRKDGFQG